MRYPLLAVLVVLGCTHTQVRTVQRRAAFDLACPADQVDVQSLGSETYGARGCGKRATYLTRGDCTEHGTCQAVQNGAVIEDSAQPEAAKSDAGEPTR